MPDPPSSISWLKEVITREGVLAALLVFLVLVMTGVVATPLMEGVRLIPQVFSQNETVIMLLQGIHKTTKAQCLNDATTEEQISRCNW